jgi:hypothetical protein
MQGGLSKISTLLAKIVSQKSRSSGGLGKPGTPAAANLVLNTIREVAVT